MILQKERVLLFRVTRDLVNALAEFGKLVRKEISFHALVCDLPILAAIRRLIYAAGRDRDLDIIRALLISDDRVHGEPAETRRPFFSMRMTPKTFVQFPCLAPVVRFEDRRRRNADIQGVIVSTRCDLPDVLERLLCRLRHLDPALFRLVPGLTHVGALRELGAEMPANRPGPHLVPALSLIEERGVNSASGEMRA